MAKKYQYNSLKMLILLSFFTTLVCNSLLHVEAGDDKKAGDGKGGGDKGDDKKAGDGKGTGDKGGAPAGGGAAAGNNDFVKQWKTACDSGGKLVIPAGEHSVAAMVFAGPCKGPVTVEVMGTLKAVPDPSKYPGDSWILFDKVTGVTLTGKGIINGNGPLMWKHNSGGGSLPASVKFIGCKDITINGISSVDAMGFHISIVECENAKISGIKITAPDSSPNTDGLHLSRTPKITVTNSIIGTGDDCIGVIDGCTDVTVDKVTCGPGHGLSIGSLGKSASEKPVSKVTMTNCIIKGADNGCRIKSFAGSPPGSCSDITFKGITMDNVKNPIIVDQNYGGKSKAPSKIKLSNIKFIDIKGTSATAEAVQLICSPEVPCEGVELANINLQFKGGQAKSICANAKVKFTGEQVPPACAATSGSLGKGVAPGSGGGALEGKKEAPAKKN